MLEDDELHLDKNATFNSTLPLLSPKDYSVLVVLPCFLGDYGGLLRAGFINEMFSKNQFQRIFSHRWVVRKCASIVVPRGGIGSVAAPKYPPFFH